MTSHNTDDVITKRSLCFYHDPMQPKRWHVFDRHDKGKAYGMIIWRDDYSAWMYTTYDVCSGVGSQSLRDFLNMVYQLNQEGAPVMLAEGEK